MNGITQKAHSTNDLIFINTNGKARASDLVRHLERGDGHLLLNTKTNKYLEGKSVNGLQLEDVYRNPNKYTMVVRDSSCHKSLYIHLFKDINGVADYVTTNESWESLTTTGAQADYYARCHFTSTQIVELHKQ